MPFYLGSHRVLLRRPPVVATGFTPFDVGFDFRNTLAFVTDPAGAGPMISANSTTTPLPYPTTTTINGVSVTYGMTVAFSSTDNARDRESTFDPRLAGLWFQMNTGTQAVFSVALPAAGTYTIHLAMGDADNARTQSTIQFLDGSTSLFTVVGSPPAGSFYDATGTVYTNTAWPGSETGVSVTMSGTTLNVKLGTSTNVGSQTDLAYFRIVRTA
jgi:hypothetical protein